MKLKIDVTAPSGPIRDVLGPFWIFLLFGVVIRVCRWLRGRVSSKQKQKNFGSNKNNQNRICFAFFQLIFETNEHFVSVCFWCFWCKLKQTKQTNKTNARKRSETNRNKQICCKMNQNKPSMFSIVYVHTCMCVKNAAIINE